jgi:predicted GIY-YIG superfamily endonuclease
MPGMSTVQLRLFPAPKPLVERLGVEFFKRVPRQPGVYLMSGEQHRLLYIGKANNLRQRLNSYKNAQPDRVSRKVIRLVHQVRAITWELCESADAALLRENELLRLHKPVFNVQNTRPEHYGFIGLRVCGDAVHLRLTRQPVLVPGETLYGAFKSLGRVRAGFTALLRLLWATEHRPASVHHYPMPLVAERCPSDFSVRMLKSEAGRVGDLLRRMLAGQDDELINLFASKTPLSPDVDLCQQRFHEMDVETLRLFHRFGPARNRDLREHCVYDREVIAQDDLDDLLALTPKPTRIRELQPRGSTVAG